MANRPPVPPANRSDKGPKDKNLPDHDADAKVSGHDARDRNLKQQGRQGNISQNTTNQGYQQDR
jgi:hypothetical protein